VTLRNLLQDPLLLKELRTCMRSRMAIGLVTLFVCVMTVIVMSIYTVNDGFTAGLGSDIGRSIFTAISFLLLGIIILIAPLVTAGSVSGERDHKTFDSLMATPVSGTAILTAKLMAVVAYFVALLFLSLPLFSISFIMGGVSPSNIACVVSGLAIIAVMSCSVGIFWSTRFTRSIAAIPMASVVVIGITVLLAIMNQDCAFQVMGLVSPIELITAITRERIVPFFRFSCPAVVPGMLLPAFISVWLFESSRQNLAFPSERRFLAVRLWFLAGISLMWAFVLGESLGAAAGGGIHSPADPWQGVQGPLVLKYVCYILLIVPWVCSNAGVTFSNTNETASRPVLWARGLFTDGVRFSCVLAGVLLFLMVVGFNAMSVPATAARRICFALGAGVLPMSLALGLTARLLAGRKTGPRRWIGLGVSYVLLLLLTFVPVIAAEATQYSYGGIMPVWAQWCTLLSPACALTWLETATMPRFWLPNVTATSPIHPLAVSAIFYGTIALILGGFVYLPRRRPPRE